MLGAFSGGGLRATVFLPAELRDLVRDAGVIVRGHVADVQPQWAADRRRVDSLLVLEAEDYLKGSGGTLVGVLVPGGIMGAYRSLVVGAPVFEPGEEVVLFLRADGAGVARLLGLTQGVFRVRREESTGERSVMPPALLREAAADARFERGDRQLQGMPLEAFETLVRGLLAEGGAAVGER